MSQGNCDLVSFNRIILSGSLSDREYKPKKQQQTATAAATINEKSCLHSNIDVDLLILVYGWNNKYYWIGQQPRQEMKKSKKQGQSRRRRKNNTRKKKMEKIT